MQSAQTSKAEGTWHTMKESLSSSGEAEGGADEVEQLIRRHEAFRKAASTWKEHFTSLRQVDMATTNKTLFTNYYCVNLCISLSNHAYVHPSFCVQAHATLICYLSIQLPSVHPTILSIHQFIKPATCSSIHPCVPHTLIHPSIHRLVHLSMNPFIHVHNYPPSIA